MKKQNPCWMKSFLLYIKIQLISSAVLIGKGKASHLSSLEFIIEYMASATSETNRIM